ncbi:MAG: hypothetical protein ABFS45_17440 [Pseudomonadota bacterium]
MPQKPFESLEELQEIWSDPLSWAEIKFYCDAPEKLGRRPLWWDERKQEQPATQWATRLKRQHYRHELTDSTQRGFFRACAEADQSILKEWLDTPNASIETILSLGGDELKPLFRAHLHCALFTRQLGGNSSEEVANEVLLPIREETGLPLGFLRDLMYEFQHEEPRPAEHQQAVMLSLVETHADGRQRGVMATLTLARMNTRDGALYPEPRLAFVSRDPDFRDAEEDACRYVRSEGLWPKDCDVRWSIERRDGKSVGARLCGNSAGAAFAVGLAKLFAGE